ncbi:hypothetical protein M441DRAFT_83989 [Trichoderma asperellum CBS 433.97]|uniref:Xylanolytic transcriptional activator regulatory domain-containing protein n=1 Tax=Trichoderma asperellum (strain ATCC 204424 / CBS 433.97 / NBRC 101777) TaxID=1042311 RepID=A0A2T3YU87_TRIA4|nr:hypothetical protein M441DRAFT_83989 [Trichoderma asperellum CBS 433.97]PTB36141.1 hypothetical protein M441DRAFT_83989 [Trichoderma asperellum CBS 433.97]
MEDEFTNLRRRIRAIEEHLALTSVHNMSSKVKQRETELDSLQYKQHLDTCQEEPSSQVHSLALNKSRLYGATHWLHGGHEFKRVAVLNGYTDQSTEEETTRQQKVQLERLFRKCKHLAQKLKQNDPGRSITQSGPGLPTSCKSWADQMVHLYLTRFESVFRILHIPSFRAEYEEFSKNPEQSPLALQFKVKLVMAIGSSLYRDTADADNIGWNSCRWVHEAQTWVSGPVKDRISLDGLQVQCLLILARQVLSIGGDLVWIAVGTLVRTAMHMGLHRDPVYFRKMTLLEAEVRRRLWATILEINLQASLDSGAPLAVSFDDFNTKSPRNVNDEDISENTEILPYYDENTVTDMSLQLLLFRYLRPRSEIINRMNGACSSFSQAEVQCLTLTLNRACRECSASLEGNNNGDATKIFKQNMANLLLGRFLLTLHRPLATASRVGDPGFHFSRKVCLDSATALLLPPHNPDFYHLTLIGGGIFKNRIIHASLAICSDLIIELEELDTMAWPSTYGKMLVDVLREALRQTAERIRVGETNLRLNMKLNVVLCRAECAESGSSRQLRMIEAAQESLKMAYTVMQSRLCLMDGGRRDEGCLELRELDWQNLGISVDEDWNESNDMPDIGLDELLWLGLGEGEATVSHEAEW